MPSPQPTFNDVFDQNYHVRDTLAFFKEWNTKEKMQEALQSANQTSKLIKRLSEFTERIHADDVESVIKPLLELGWPINAAFENKFSGTVNLLTQAISLNHEPLVQCLLNLGAEPRADIQHPLYDDDTGFSALYCASYNGSLPILNMLIKKDPNLIKREHDYVSQVGSAVFGGVKSAKVLLWFLDHGFDANAQSNSETLLHLLARLPFDQDTPAAFHRLVQHIDINTVNNKGFPPILCCRDPEMLSLFLDAGANPNHNLHNLSYPPLAQIMENALAYEEAMMPIVKKLLISGINVEQKMNPQGQRWKDYPPISIMQWVYEATQNDSKYVRTRPSLWSEAMAERIHKLLWDHGLRPSKDDLESWGKCCPYLAVWVEREREVERLSNEVGSLRGLVGKNQHRHDRNEAESLVDPPCKASTEVNAVPMIEITETIRKSKRRLT
jgi:ankyrin repeat protein